MILSFAVNQAVNAGSSVWLAAWSDHSGDVLSSSNETAAAANDTLSDALDNDYYLGVLGGFGVSQAAASFFRNWFFFWVCANGSVSIHDSLFRSVIRATMRFFDVTPTGSVINRFSGDLHVVDLPLPRILSAFFFNMMEILSALILISISSPVFLVAVGPLAAVYILILRSSTTNVI